MTITNRTLDIAALACIAISIVTAVWPSSSAGGVLVWIAGVAFSSFMLSLPYLALWYFGRGYHWARLKLVALILMGVSLAFWLANFWKTFVSNPNPTGQDGLLFLVAPAIPAIMVTAIGYFLRAVDRVPGEGEA